MNDLDINLLPWHERRLQRWQAQRNGFYLSVIMLVGWCGCGHLWHGLWRSHYAEQTLFELQSTQTQQSVLIHQQEEWLAAELWRQQAWERQQQRLQDNRQLALLWQTLMQPNLTVQSLFWQPLHVQLTVINPKQVDLDQLLRSTPLYSSCRALSDTMIDCLQEAKESEVRHE